MKSTNFYVSCHLCFSETEYDVEHAIELTQDLDVSCSSEHNIVHRKYGDLREYEHVVKARLEHGI